MKLQLRKTARGLGDEDLLLDMRRVAKLLGRETLTLSEYSEHGLGHASTIQRRFGSWFKALEQAGLNPSRSRIGIPTDELFETLRDAWMSLGRQPRYAEVKVPISRFSAGTYENRFSNWTGALEQFVEWTNSEEASDNAPIHADAESSTRPGLPPRRTKREISERLRFRILVRDGFTCPSCGSSPLRTPCTELHVDHITPWSKGGETVEENLETKCARCNLGKGNAFEA